MKKIILVLVVVLFVACKQQDYHKTEYSVDLSKLKGCVIVGSQFDWNTHTTGAQLIAFKRGDIIFTQSYMRSLFENYNVGDTIK